MKNVSVNGTNYTGVSEVQLSVTGGGTANFRDVDEITTPSGSVTISENGTHDVSAYAQAVVNVAGSGGDEDYKNSLIAMISGTGANEIVIPEGTTQIRDSAFKALQNISIKMADSVETIGNDAFGYADGSYINKLPANLKTIGARAFQYGTFSSTVLEIPQGVTSIGSMAFHTARGFTTVTFKGTPTSINDDAFYGCYATTFNVPWAEGAVAGAPWGKSGATINYNYTGA